MDYYQKYQKYKFKYLNLLNQIGGVYDIISTNYLKEYIDDYKINVQNNGLALQFVPPSMINSGICKIAVQQNGLALKFVPSNIINSDICKIAVQNNGLALQFVPSNMINSDICKIAVQQNGLALFLLKNFNSTIINLLAVNNNLIFLSLIESNIDLQIKYMMTEDEEKQKRNKLFEMIELFDSYIEKLSTDEQNNYKNIINVQQNGLALQFVPPEMRNSDICKIAVQQNGLALEFVPSNMINSDICKIAVQQNGAALHLIPPEKRDSDICKIAVQQDGLALEFVQQNQNTENIFDICKIAVQQNELALQLVKPHLNYFSPEQKMNLLFKKEAKSLIEYS